MKALSKPFFADSGVSEMAMSISDVARRARVSISTVSRVLNRRNLVSEETRERVEIAIRELGYRPNAFARGLMLGRTELVGLVLPDLHGDFYSEIIRGADQAATALGYNLVVSSSRDAGDSHSVLNALEQRAVLDGIAIMVADITDGVQETLRDFGLPFVVLDGDIDGVPHDAVVIDQRQGAMAITRHVLRSVDLKRLIFVGGLATNVDTAARLDGCRRVLIEAGLGLASDDIHYLDYQYATAFALARQRIGDWAVPGTCVFAANDEMAAGIVAAANEAGVSIPAQLAIVGFDDTRVAHMTRPALTTVRVPMARMGAEAIGLLCTRIADPQRPPTRISLQPELVVRESCGSRR